ncbi:hypothetical protein OX89_09380 [Diaphorobacter sp. J5-51]|nr:hypothetical protein OX89_09380 [Diaphorobacter sp. J5-51]
MELVHGFHATVLMRPAGVVGMIDGFSITLELTVAFLQIRMQCSRRPLHRAGQNEGSLVPGPHE